MSALAGIGAIVAASLFTGAATYISLVEHPARLVLDEAPLLAQWKSSYARALPIQSGLAIVGGVLGLVTWYLSRDGLSLAGSIVILANWPFTLLGIMPANNKLNAIAPTDVGPESRKLLLLWGRLHNVRSALGAVATALFVVACLQTM